MRPGDSVLILCTVTEADEHSYTMAINATAYVRGQEAIEITKYDVLIRDSQREEIP